MTTTRRRIYDTAGSDWAGIPRSRSHSALVAYAVRTIRACGAYGSDPSVETTDEGAFADVHVESHGERTMLRIYSGGE